MNSFIFLNYQNNMQADLISPEQRAFGDA